MNYIQIFKTFFSQLGKTREYILKFAALPFSFLGMTADDLMELCINPKDSYTNLSNMWMHANGALLPLMISYVYIRLYKKDSTKPLYRIFSYLVTLMPIASMLAWGIIPFAYLQGKAPINDDVTNFLTIFCENYHPLIVSAVAVALIGIGIVLMIKKRVIHNFIEEIKRNV